MPAQMQRPIEAFTHHRVGAHQHNPEDGVQRQRREHHAEFRHRRDRPWRRVDADHHPVEEVATQQEVQVHQEMGGVVSGDGVEDAAQVERIDAGDEQHGRDDRVSQEPRQLAVQRNQNPLARAGRFAARRRGQRAQREGDGSAEREQDRREHREHHVGCHVHAEHRRHVAADTRRRRDQQHRTAAHPRERPTLRPSVAPPVQAAHPGEIDQRHDDRRRAEDEVEPPVEQDPRHRRRPVEVVADLDLGDRRVADPRRRRGAAQTDRDAVGRAEDHGLEQGETNQRAARRRVVAQCGKRDAALPPAEDAQRRVAGAAVVLAALPVPPEVQPTQLFDTTAWRTRSVRRPADSSALT